MIRDQSDNFEGYEPPEDANNDPYDLVTTDPRVLERSFKHALNSESLPLVKYILNGADKCFVNATINDEQVLSIIESLDEPEMQEILKFLCKKDITLTNEGDPTLNLRNNKNASYSLNKSVEEVKVDKTKKNSFDGFLVKEEEPKKKKKKVRAKKNPFTKFLQKADIVEIAIRAPNISDEEELRVITVLYEQLAVPTNETVALYKLLIYYEQIATFEMLLTYRLTEAKVQSVDRNKIREDTTTEFMPGRNDDDNIYDLDEIISDAFSYAISINHLHIAFYLLRTYDEEVYGNKLLSIKSIVNSFKNDDSQVNQVLYLEERLFILEKFMKFIEYKTALEFFEVFYDQITDDPNINFLVYSTNPLKIIVMLLNIVITLSSKHQNLKFHAKRVREGLCDIGNSVIDHTSSMNEIQDMLLDKTYSGLEIINMIEDLNIIELLANPMVDSIVSNMYLGPYERESFLNKSTCFKVIEEEIMYGPQSKSLVTKSFRIFEYGNCLGSFKKELSNVKLFRGLQEDQNNNFDFGDEEGTGEEVGHMFQYKIWKRSLDVKLIVNLILILTISVLLQVYSFLFIRQMGRVTAAKEELDTLIENGSDTTEAYQDLDSKSNDFWNYSVALLILNLCTIGYLIRDFQVMIYLNLRGIHANPYTWLLFINIISTVLFIIWLFITNLDYRADLADYREEIRESIVIQRMKDDNNWNYKVSFAIPVSLQFARLVYALQVNRTFGPMVKIITSMIVDVLRFLVLFAALFFIFVGAGQILFHELDAYSDLEESLKTLFASAIGEFSYETYDELQDIDPKVGYIFVTAFLIIANIMLLNFLQK